MIDELIEITLDDLRVGDTVVDFTRAGWGGRWAGDGAGRHFSYYVVTALAKSDGLDYLWTDDPPVSRIQLQCHAQGEYQVTRLLILPRTRLASVKANDRFPHTCPSCGRAAYIGFTAVEHADGGGCGG